jgi:imidazolonepropionase-like amidohydrolase
MTAIVFTGVAIFDGTGARVFPGEVRVEGTRITMVARGSEKVRRDGAVIVDGKGSTLMPGLIEPHAHLTIPYALDRPSEGLMPPDGEKYFASIHNARVILDAGYTAAFSGGCLNAEVEVRLKREIAAGHLPGPRLRACSIEYTSMANVGWKPGSKFEFDEAAAKPDVVAKWIREGAQLGCDNVKIVLDGRSAVAPKFWHLVNYSNDAIAVAARTAHELGLKIAGHALTAEGVKQAVRSDFDIIYHAAFVDDEGLDMIEAKKDRVFLSPGVGIVYAEAFEAGFSPEMVEERGSKRLFEAYCETYQKIRKRGLAVLPGGDYGFPTNPHGKEARELQHFVDHLGYQPQEVLSAATSGGARLMELSHELGLIRDGYLADLLLVAGDPTKDVRVLQDPKNLRVIMQGGHFHKGAPAFLSQAA